MITERKQPITCFISTKSEILHDQATPCCGAPRGRRQVPACCVVVVSDTEKAAGVAARAGGISKA